MNRRVFICTAIAAAIVPAAAAIPAIAVESSRIVCGCEECHPELWNYDPKDEQ